METTITVPDGLLAEADSLAGRLGMTRSELCAAALGEFVARHHPGASATEPLDRLYTSEPSAMDAALARAQRLAPRPQQG